MRGVISPQLTQSLNVQSSKVSSIKKSMCGPLGHIYALTSPNAQKKAQTNLLWPFFFRLSRGMRVGGDPDPVSAGGGSPHCPHLSSLARALSSPPLWGSFTYDVTKNFGIFNPLPLVTVTVTQPISILVLFWAKPLPSSVRTRGRHM